MGDANHCRVNDTCEQREICNSSRIFHSKLFTHYVQYNRADDVFIMGLTSVRVV